MLKRFVVLWLSLFVAALPALAAIEETTFADAGQRERYEVLIAELRCPMCLNSNLAGSDAPIAADLRAEVQEQILAGESDDEILDFLVDRYGEFILYNPPLQAGTVVLWFGPPLLLIAGFLILRRMVAGQRQAESAAALSAQEQQRLQDLLGKDNDTGAGNG